LSDSRKPNDVEHLPAGVGRRGDDPSPPREVYWDPSACQLVETNQPSPDAVLVTQTDGDFWCGGDRPSDVEHLLEQRAGSSPPANLEEMYFDPNTGDLVAAMNRPSPDAVLATGPTDDGYFRH
jgi:hypothetical protein